MEGWRRREAPKDLQRIRVKTSTVCPSVKLPEIPEGAGGCLKTQSAHRALTGGGMAKAKAMHSEERDKEEGEGRGRERGGQPLKRTLGQGPSPFKH